MQDQILEINETVTKLEEEKRMFLADKVVQKIAYDNMTVREQEMLVVHRKELDHRQTIINDLKAEKNVSARATN